MPRIKAGELHLNYAEAGTGDAFLFIPGLMGLLDAWDFQVPHFSKRYRCITFDHRGTGESDKPENAYSTELIAKDAIALLDALGVERAHVAGTSTGGCVLQHLALDHPGRLRCCIFTNTWTRADPYMTRLQTSRKQIALAYGQEEYIKFSSLWTCGWTQFRHMYHNLLALERRQKETIAPVEVIAARLDMTLNHDRTADLSRIRKPSLIIAAKDDALTPPYFSQDLNRIIQGSKLVVLEEGGHYSYRRSHKEWNAAVDAFLAEIEGKA
ncbi:MAG: alpha/beta fold hydrolase [Candidatus Tectomicrobia bacterium]|uniref:Alpha/beta fold hydrolase n=1 Tax=Tectimicrobiota bacterium TaxID=2528274 RepID=A0A932MNV3_UNCTE|nr:alpha/beta fold hydrolase [Candidatus Tectomicrobia bacterium]